MNTNKLRSINMMLVAMMLTTVTVMSCGSDDPEPPTPPTPNEDTIISDIGIKTPMEKKLVSMDNNDGYNNDPFFVYNNEYLTAYGCYEPIIFVDTAFVRYENHDGEIEKIYDIKTNVDGFITSYKFLDIREDDYELSEYKSEYECSYSDKHLTKISERYSGFETYRGKTEQSIGSCTYSYRWTNDNLTQIDIVEAGTKGNYHYTVDVVYGDQINTFKQFTWGLIAGCYGELFPYDFEDEYFLLPLVGLFGEGPAYLPSRIRMIDSSFSDSYSYKLNSDGSIAEERELEGNRTYSYSYLDPSNIAPRTIMPGIKGDHHKPLTHRLPHERMLERMNSNR